MLMLSRKVGRVPQARNWRQLRTWIEAAVPSFKSYSSIFIGEMITITQVFVRIIGPETGFEGGTSRNGRKLTMEARLSVIHQSYILLLSIQTLIHYSVTHELINSPPSHTHNAVECPDRNQGQQVAKSYVRIFLSCDTPQAKTHCTALVAISFADSARYSEKLSQI